MRSNFDLTAGWFFSLRVMDLLEHRHEDGCGNPSRGWGQARIYGIVGDRLNGLTGSVRRNGKIEWLHFRHEE